MFSEASLVKKVPELESTFKKKLKKSQVLSLVNISARTRVQVQLLVRDIRNNIAAPATASPRLINIGLMIIFWANTATVKQRITAMNQQ